MISGAVSIAQVVRTLQSNRQSATSVQLPAHLNKQMGELAGIIREYLLTQIEQGGKHKLRRDGGGLYQTAQVKVSLEGATLSLPDYALSLDKGRRKKAKLVPLAELIAWLQRYRIQSRSTAKARAGSKGSLNLAARAMQQSIYQQGIRARPFLQATLEYQQQLIAHVVDELILPQLVRVLELTFNPN